jgi:hypothetical protein
MEVKVPVYVCEHKTETVCVCALVCVGVGCLVVIHKGGLLFIFDGFCCVLLL